MLERFAMTTRNQLKPSIEAPWTAAAVIYVLCVGDRWLKVLLHFEKVSERIASELPNTVD